MNRYNNRFYRNECWVGDTYVLNFMNGGMLERRYLILFMDVSSGQVAGWHIAKEAGREAELEALRAAIQTAGIPGKVMMDKMRPELMIMNGRNHRLLEIFRKIERFFSSLTEFLQEEFSNMADDVYLQRADLIGGYVAFFVSQYNAGKER